MSTNPTHAPPVKARVEPTRDSSTKDLEEASFSNNSRKDTDIATAKLPSPQEVAKAAVRLEPEKPSPKYQPDKVEKVEQVKAPDSLPTRVVPNSEGAAQAKTAEKSEPLKSAPSEPTRTAESKVEETKRILNDSNLTLKAETTVQGLYTEKSINDLVARYEPKQKSEHLETKPILAATPEAVSSIVEPREKITRNPDLIDKGSRDILSKDPVNLPREPAIVEPRLSERIQIPLSERVQTPQSLDPKLPAVKEELVTSLKPHKEEKLAQPVTTERSTVIEKPQTQKVVATETRMVVGESKIEIRKSIEVAKSTEAVSNDPRPVRQPTERTTERIVVRESPTRQPENRVETASKQKEAVVLEKTRREQVIDPTRVIAAPEKIAAKADSKERPTAVRKEEEKAPTKQTKDKDGTAVEGKAKAADTKVILEKDGAGKASRAIKEAIAAEKGKVTERGRGDGAIQSKEKGGVKASPETAIKLSPKAREDVQVLMKTLKDALGVSEKISKAELTRLKGAEKIIEQLSARGLTRKEIEQIIKGAPTRIVGEGTKLANQPERIQLMSKALIEVAQRLIDVLKALPPNVFTRNTIKALQKMIERLGGVSARIAEDKGPDAELQRARELRIIVIRALKALEKDPLLNEQQKFDHEEELEQEQKVERQSRDNEVEELVKSHPELVLDSDGATGSTILVHRITGRVYSRRTGLPVPGVVVNGGSLGYQLTGIHGEFNFSNVPQGATYSIIVSKPQHQFSPSSSGGTLQHSIHLEFAAVIEPVG